VRTAGRLMVLLSADPGMSCLQSASAALQIHVFATPIDALGPPMFDKPAMSVA
jgi:hypothetical protein